MKKSLTPWIILVAFWCLYLTHPWEWSLMDDTNFVLRLEKFRSQFGLLGGVWQHVKDVAVLDRGWGLFRPSWWVYCSTVYLLPSRIAYGLRLLQLYGIIVLPLWAFMRMNRDGGDGINFSTASPTLARRSAPDFAANRHWLMGIGACLLLCNRPLYEGISCLSMQEFSGSFFVALGIWLGFRPSQNVATASPNEVVIQSRHSVTNKANILALFSVKSFIIAAWFKTPFIWFLILYCAGLWVYEKRRAAALLGFVVSSFTLFEAVTWARYGGYTSRITKLHLATIATALKNFVVPGSYVILLTAALTVILILARASVPLKKYWRGYALLIGGGVYLANLLPWGAFGYYFMGPLFLFSTGILFTVSSRLVAIEWGAEKKTLISGLATFLLCFVLLKSAFKIYFKDEAVRLSRDWALTIPLEGQTLGYNGEEASIRFAQLMEIRTGHRWKNTVVFIPAEATPGDNLDYYVVSKEATANKLACKEVLLDFKAGQICRSK